MSGGFVVVLRKNCLSHFHGWGKTTYTNSSNSDAEIQCAGNKHLSVTPELGPASSMSVIAQGQLSEELSKADFFSFFPPSVLGHVFGKVWT